MSSNQTLYDILEAHARQTPAAAAILAPGRSPLTWRGESVTLPNGAGIETEIRIFPRPLQPTLPMWLASHSDETFIKAGEIGANILTTIWNTDIEMITRQIGLYRQSLDHHGRDPATGKVTLMLHTFIGETMEVVRENVKSAYHES
jgi:alkanesulfonate monooxygenase SsuD/methylene tetrahydromethanopterin reductase-like flavin-dependent oxidoreductase (luciferase family)